MRRLIFSLLLLLPLLAPAARADATVLVTVAGLDGELLANVKAALEIEQLREQPGLNAPLIREMYNRSAEQITRALQPFGYYQPKIDSELLPPPADGKAWQASYRIDKGPPVTVTSEDIAFEGPGKGDPKLAALLPRFGLPSGEILDHQRYESAKRELLQQVQGLGYRDAKLDVHRVRVRLETGEASIELRIDTGPRYVIGPITFEQRRFNPEYLARFLVLEPGQAYNAAALAEQRRILSSSGYFREVEIQPQTPTTGDSPAIPLRIRLEAYEPNRYRGSLGWGTDTGFGVQLDWTRRYVGGRGQSFNASVAAVEERNRLAGDLTYNVPLEPLAGSHLEFTARHEGKDLTHQDVGLSVGGDTRIETNLVSGFWHLPTSRWGPFTLEARPGLSAVTENYDVFQVLFGHYSNEEKQVLIETIGKEAYDTLSPDFEALVANLRLTARRSDDQLYIRDGDYFRLDLLGASDQMGSNITFWQASLNTWHIRPLFEADRLLLRSSFGYSDAETRNVLTVDFNRMPEYYEFRAGGVRSIRGYGWEELVPEDAITGGKHQIIGSIEYEHEIIPDWSVAAFVDGGNAFNDVHNIDPKFGAGIGVRWRSPVGVARVDLGIPLDKAKDSFQIYVTVGPEF